MASITVGAIAGLASAGASAFSASQQAGAAGKAAENLQPFTTQGGIAANVLGTRLGTDYQSSPGYQWQLQQGIDAIQNSASAQGGVVSGNTLKALQTYGTGLANQNYQQWINNLLSLAQLGGNAATGQGNFLTQQGNANAAGTVGTTNALTNMLPFLANMFQSNPGALNSTIASGSPLLTGAGADPSAVFGAGGLGF